MIQECIEHKSERDSLTETVARLSTQIESLELERKIIDSTLLDLNSSVQLVKSENALLREQLSAVEVLRVDLEAQLNQSEEEKEKLFLNLQEKIDEAEATELTVKDLTQQGEAQAAKCDAYETKINELEKSVCELTVCKQNLSEFNESLNQKINDNRESLSKLQVELETMHKNAEHQNSEKIQLMHTIDQLTTDVKANEVELNETRVKLSECVDANAQLKIEHQYTRKCAEDLAAERDGLIVQIESAERELLNSREALVLKNQEADELSKKIEQLKTENETLHADRSNSATDLNENFDRLKQSTEEIQRYKVELDEKVKSIESLSDEIEKLKKVESSMAAESNKLSVELKELVNKLESVESSRDTLSLKCISLNDELKTAEDKCTDLESKIVDRNLMETSKNDDIKLLELQVDKLKQQMAEVTEVREFLQFLFCWRD